MKADTEMKILNLCKGMSLKQASKRLEIMQKHIATKKLELRLKLC